MNGVSIFASGLIVGVLGLYMTMHHSLVRASDGFHVIPKITAKMVAKSVKDFVEMLETLDEFRYPNRC